MSTTLGDDEGRGSREKDNGRGDIDPSVIEIESCCEYSLGCIAGVAEDGRWTCELRRALSSGVGLSPGAKGPPFSSMDSLVDSW